MTANFVLFQGSFVWKLFQDASPKMLMLDQARLHTAEINSKSLWQGSLLIAS